MAPVLPGNDSTKSNKVTKPKKPLYSRASKACSSCRRQKTRCFPSSDSIACLRCASMSQVCSFEEDLLKRATDPDNSKENIIGCLPNLDQNGSFDIKQTVQPESQVFKLSPIAKMNLNIDRKLKTLESGVSQILGLLRREGLSLSEPAAVSLDDTNEVQTEFGVDSKFEHKQHQQARQGNYEPGLDQIRPTAYAEQEKNFDEITTYTDYNEVTLNPFGSKLDLSDIPSLGAAHSTFITSPFASFTQCVAIDNLPIPLSNLALPRDHSRNSGSEFFIAGSLSKPQAIELLSTFRERYGRWVSFAHHISTELLLDRIMSKCPLLLIVACSLSLKYSDPYIRKHAEKYLRQSLVKELNQNLMIMPQCLEFMQALVILSVYALTLSDESFSVDGWFLSGVALQQFITKERAGNLISDRAEGISEEFQRLTVYRLWNHLCLAHLVNSVLSGRISIINSLNLHSGRKVLDLPESTNFDGRMVAECSLQLIVCEFLNSQSASKEKSLQVARGELVKWLEQWSYLFEQPANQFVELGYHYGYFLVLFHWNFKKLQSETTDVIYPGIQDSSVIDRILDVADSVSMRSMLYHTEKVLDSINSVDNSSYFAFLSDQVHFICVYSALVMVRLLRVITNRDRISVESVNEDLNQVEISSLELTRKLDRCYKLSVRYKQVSVDENDIPQKYATAIQSALVETFPTVQLSKAWLTDDNLEEN
ncbi:BA75_02405T0 [Komagataella pastoris]|uniref:BA75_02405T0 n=1 Tax=Komagataella pastoris TaxID=4922 RepID=A0A1B2JAR9_PICPA|nr:BA75_02405T0 [Komagataella pastoris]